MNWSELRKHHPGLPESSDGYHQHANGGGWVADSASVDTTAYIGDEASVCDEARVFGKARVCDVVTQTPLYIQGTCYWIGYAGGNLIASGCMTKPVNWWLENVERCAEEHGYDDDQQREYRLHVEHIATWMRLYGYVEECEDAASHDGRPEDPHDAAR